MSSSFYLTLPSNSSTAFHPDNRAGHFFTNLPQMVELNGDYEVGLSEIQYTGTYFNVDKTWLSYVDSRQRDGEEGQNTTKIFIEIEGGSFDSNDLFIKAVNNAITSFGSNDQMPLALGYNRRTKIALLRVFHGTTHLQLGPELQKTLGFETDIFPLPGRYEAGGGMGLVGNFKNIFVYSDIIRPRVVGDVLVPLLRVLPAYHDKKMIDIQFNKPEYSPLSRFSFQTIEIKLTDNTGNEILFKRGYTVVTLHIRRRRPDY